jgi:hypothetical protein
MTRLEITVTEITQITVIHGFENVGSKGGKKQSTYRLTKSNLRLSLAHIHLQGEIHGLVPTHISTARFSERVSLGHPSD